MRLLRLSLVSALTVLLSLSVSLIAQEEGTIQLELFTFKLSNLRVTDTGLVDTGLRVDYDWSLTVPQGDFVFPDSKLTLTLWAVEVTEDPSGPPVLKTFQVAQISTLTAVDFLISGQKSSFFGSAVGNASCDWLIDRNNYSFVVVADISGNGVKNNQPLTIPAQTYNIQLDRTAVNCQKSQEANEPVLVQAGELEVKQPGAGGDDIELRISRVKLQVVPSTFGRTQLVYLGILSFDLKRRWCMKAEQ